MRDALPSGDIDHEAKCALAEEVAQLRAEVNVQRAHNEGEVVWLSNPVNRTA